MDNILEEDGDILTIDLIIVDIDREGLGGVIIIIKRDIGSQKYLKIFYANIFKNFYAK